MKTKFLSFLIVVFSFAFGFAQELVTNGDFNAGYTGWSGGNAANVVTVGGNSYYQTNVTTPGQPAYTNNLSYVLSLTAGTKYTLKFDSWSDAPRGFIVGLGLNHNPYTSVTAQQNITTAVTTYTLSFTPTVSDSDSRIIFDMGAEVGIVRIDNVSLKVFVQDPTTDASLSDLKVKGTTIAGFLTGTKSYTYELPVGTTIVPQITSATTTNAAASKIITQATALPGSATVKVTAVDGTTTSTYTVNFIADLPNASPYHTTTGTLLPLNFNTNATVNDTGTPSTATVWNPDYTFGGFTSIKNLATSGTNNAIYTDFTTGYGAGSAANRNVSSYSYFNFDYFVPANETPGANGDEFYFDLISNSPVKESNYEIKPTGGDAVLVKGSWQTISVPLATFVAKGFNPATFFQFKLGATSDINTKAVYFDNMYFSTVAATLGVKDAVVKNALSIYPNPVRSGSNIMISSQVKSVEIYNMNGQLVRTSTSQSVSSQGLTSGLYLVKATDSKGSVQTTKLIVK